MSTEVSGELEAAFGALVWRRDAAFSPKREIALGSRKAPLLENREKWGTPEPADGLRFHWSSRNIFWFCLTPPSGIGTANGGYPERVVVIPSCILDFGNADKSVRATRVVADF